MRLNRHGWQHERQPENVIRIAVGVAVVVIVVLVVLAILGH